MRCLHGFSREDLLEKHSPDCFALNGTQKIDMPAKGSKIYFKNYHRIQPVPFVIYADFEALTKKINTCHQNNDSGAPAARRAAKRSPIVIMGKKRKPMKDFLMVLMASGIARGRVRTTTTTTESRNMAAILQKIG